MSFEVGGADPQKPAQHQQQQSQQRPSYHQQQQQQPAVTPPGQYQDAYIAYPSQPQQQLAHNPDVAAGIPMVQVAVANSAGGGRSGSGGLSPQESIVVVSNGTTHTNRNSNINTIDGPAGSTINTATATATNTATTSNCTGSRQQWTTGLFQIDRDWAACSDAVLCPYCLSGAHFNRLFRDQEGVYWPLCCSMVALDVCCCGTFHCNAANAAVALVVRRELRRRYSLVDEALEGFFLRTDADDVGVHSNDDDDNTINGTENSSTHDTTTAATASSGFLATPALTTCGSALLLGLDLVIACLCQPCAAAQHHREMALRGRWPSAAAPRRRGATRPSSLS